MAAGFEELQSFQFQAESLQQDSISFGRFEHENLLWEKRSSFSHNRHLEEVERYSRPGSVFEKKAYFEAYFKSKGVPSSDSSRECKSFERCYIENAGHRSQSEATDHKQWETIKFDAILPEATGYKDGDLEIDVRLESTSNAKESTDIFSKSFGEDAEVHASDLENLKCCKEQVIEIESEEIDFGNNSKRTIREKKSSPNLISITKSSGRVNGSGRSYKTGAMNETNPLPKGLPAMHDKAVKTGRRAQDKTHLVSDLARNHNSKKVLPDCKQSEKAIWRTSRPKMPLPQVYTPRSHPPESRKQRGTMGTRSCVSRAEMASTSCSVVPAKERTQNPPSIKVTPFPIPRPRLTAHAKHAPPSSKKQELREANQMVSQKGKAGGEKSGLVSVAKMESIPQYHCKDRIKAGTQTAIGSGNKNMCTRSSSALSPKMSTPRNGTIYRNNMSKMMGKSAQQYLT